MILKVEVTEQEIRNVLAAYINEYFGTNFKGDELPLEVKSAQNYRSEWEKANIRLNVQVVR